VSSLRRSVPLESRAMYYEMFSWLKSRDITIYPQSPDPTFFFFSTTIGTIFQESYIKTLAAHFKQT